MIRSLLALSSGKDAAQLRAVVLWGSMTGVTQGLAMVLLVPLLTALTRGEWTRAGVFLGALAVTVIVHSLCMVIATQRGFHSSMGVIRSMHRGLGRTLLRLPLSWFGPESQGRASHIAVRGTLFVATAAMDVLVPLIVNITAPFTVAVAMLVIDWRMGLALIASAPLIWGATKLATRWESRAEERVRQHRSQTDFRLVEFAQNQQVLRASGMAEAYPPLLDTIEIQRGRARSALWFSVGSMVIQGFVVQTVLGIAVTLAVWEALAPQTSGHVNGTMALALIGVVVLASGPLRIMASMSTALEQSSKEIDEVRALLETPQLPEPDSPQPFPATADVELDGIGFAYDADPQPGKRILDRVNVRLPDRSYTALIGPSGSGKTTILRLIARLWDVTDGAVRIGGVDIRDMSTEDLYSHISMIFQDVYLFDDTLWANIKLGNENASDDEVLEAARKARVTDIADRLPGGWDACVGEGGGLLSGGERQRVSIARALLRKAPVVLCDEPSSALDPSTRRAVTESLEQLAGEATVVVVAHQLETIRHASQILLLDEGSVVAEGTHEELTGSVQRYRDFWAMREEAGRWSLADN